MHTFSEVRALRQLVTSSELASKVFRYATKILDPSILYRIWRRKYCGSSASPKVSKTSLTHLFPLGPSIQLFCMSITSVDSSLNVALIPANTLTSPLDWGSTTLFAFSIRWRTVASRPSILHAMLVEAGVVVDKDIECYATSSLKLAFYPTLVRTLCCDNR